MLIIIIKSTDSFSICEVIKINKPNFLVFVADQMQSACLGCNGNPDVKTPNIDNLAEEGHSFKNAYCVNPICMPSRATLATGLTPRQHGCVCNGTGLPEDIPTVMQALSNNGYRTFSSGKIHLQPLGELAAEGKTIYTKESRHLWQKGIINKLENYYGFEKVYLADNHVNCTYGDYYNEMMQSHPDVIEKYDVSNAYYINEEAPASWRIDIPKGLHYNDRIADKCIEFIEETGKEKPFFIWCSFPDPHFPYVATKPYSEMYDPQKIQINPTYNITGDLTDRLAEERKKTRRLSESGIREITAQTYGAITHIDDCIGRVIEYLKQNGYYDNTVVIFLTDHGEYLGAQNLWGKSIWMREELIKVPFVIRLPQRYKCSEDKPVSLLDFAPTILDIAGISQSVMDIRGYRFADRVYLPGESLLPYLKGEQELKDRPVLIEYDEDFHKGPEARVRTIVSMGYKLTLYGHCNEGILIDLSKDKDELCNLYDDPNYENIKGELVRQMVFELIRTDRFHQRERLCGV